jgi:hypothetical protein
MYARLMEVTKHAPPSAKARATHEIKAMFSSYENITEQAHLDDLLTRAKRKLSVMELSFSQDKRIEINAPGVTSYIIKDGETLEGKAEKLVDVNYSNWYGGNADPEDLKRHKELSDRMNFGGPFWEGRTRNPLAMHEAPLYPYRAPEEEPDQEMLKVKEAESFADVKR